MGKIGGVMEAKVVKEPNLLIEAKQRFTRDEAIVWFWLLANAKFYRDFGLAKKLLPEDIEEKKPFVATSVIDLKELADRYPEVFDRKTTHYFKQVLKRMEQKIIFEVDAERYAELMEELGYGYLAEDLKDEKVAYFGIATILKVVLTEDGRLKIVFSPYVSPLILELKKRFTLYDFEEVLKLQSRYSIILYRLFKEQLGLKRSYLKLNAEEVIRIFDLEEKLKKGTLQIRDLKNKYVLPAVDEINEKTSLRVEMKPIRRGRGGKIVGFEFWIAKKEKNPQLEELLNNERTFNEWIGSVLKELSKDLEISKAELAEFLLSLKRIKTATALWFLLNFPQNARLYALRHLEITEDDKNIKLPDRFLEKLIVKPNQELKFLKDERIEPLLNRYLHNLLSTPQKQPPQISDQQLENLENDLFHFL